MKKRLLGLLVVLMTVAIAVPALAAPHWAYGGWNGGWNQPVNLTDDQKVQLDKMNQQLFEERKQMIENRVAWGYLTREQANWHIANLEQRLDYSKKYNVPLHGGGHGRGGHGGGCGGGCWY